MLKSINANELLAIDGGYNAVEGGGSAIFPKPVASQGYKQTHDLIMSCGAKLLEGTAKFICKQATGWSW